ncbi:hypothetical protein BBD26_0878 [Lactobacillus delbrueckii subsp. bulgaricus]|nr:hypothetical protein BBD26_0878 [Lactobacillus delbrueckii subsp. bulgaricus]
MVQAVLFDQGQHLFLWQGLGEVEALQAVAADGSEEVGLLLGFDSFAEGVDDQVLVHVDDFPQNNMAAGISLEVFSPIVKLN